MFSLTKILKVKIVTTLLFIGLTQSIDLTASEAKSSSERTKKVSKNDDAINVLVKLIAEDYLNPLGLKRSVTASQVSSERISNELQGYMELNKFLQDAISRNAQINTDEIFETTGNQSILSNHSCRYCQNELINIHSTAKRVKEIFLKQFPECSEMFWSMAYGIFQKLINDKISQLQKEL